MKRSGQTRWKNILHIPVLVLSLFSLILTLFGLSAVNEFEDYMLLMFYSGYLGLVSVHCVAAMLSNRHYSWNKALAVLIITITIVISFVFLRDDLGLFKPILLLIGPVVGSCLLTLVERRTNPAAAN